MTPDTEALSDTWTLRREVPGQYGWAVRSADGAPLLVDGCPAVGVTRWEAVQTLGLLGLTYTEVRDHA